MSAFDKIVKQIKNPPQSGHVLGNIKNIKSLTQAKDEIEKMLKSNSK